MKRNIQLKQFSLSLFIFSLLMTLFTGCDGEKDLKIIDGNLPIKTLRCSWWVMQPQMDGV